MIAARALKALAVAVVGAFLLSSAAGARTSSRHQETSTKTATGPASSSALLIGENPDPVGLDAEEMASDLEISVSDARAAINRQDEVGALLAQLSKDAGFGGLYVAYGPYTIVVLAEPGQAAHVTDEIDKVSDPELAPFIKVEETPFTEPTLLQARADIKQLDTEQLIATSDIDIQAGTVLLTTGAESDVARVQDVVDAADLPIAASHVVVSVGAFENDASYGGRRIDYPDGSWCTTGPRGRWTATSKPSRRGHYERSLAPGGSRRSPSS